MSSVLAAWPCWCTSFLCSRFLMCSPGMLTTMGLSTWCPVVVQALISCAVSVMQVVAEGVIKQNGGISGQKQSFSTGVQFTITNGGDNQQVSRSDSRTHSRRGLAVCIPS